MKKYLIHILIASNFLAIGIVIGYVFKDRTTPPCPPKIVNEFGKIRAKRDGTITVDVTQDIQDQEETPKKRKLFNR